jgi:hypothetical protein
VEYSDRVGTIFPHHLQDLLSHMPGKKIPVENFTRRVCNEGAVGGNQIEHTGNLADQWEGRMKPAPRDDDDLDVTF